MNFTKRVGYTLEEILTPEEDVTWLSRELWSPYTNVTTGNDTGALSVHNNYDVNAHDALFPSPASNTDVMVSVTLASTRVVVQTFITPVVVTVGLLGNLLNVLVLVQPTMRTSTNVYLLTLAIADCVYLLFTLALSFLGCRRQGLGRAAYAFNTYGRPTSDLAGNIAVWIIVVFTVERYVAVCHPIYGKVWCTVRRAKVMSLVAVLFCVANTLPGYFELEIQETVQGPRCGYTSLASSPAYRLGYTWWYVSLFCLLPLLALLFFNSLLIRNLLMAARVRESMLIGRVPASRDRRHDNSDDYDSSCCSCFGGKRHVCKYLCYAASVVKFSSNPCGRLTMNCAGCFRKSLCKTHFNGCVRLEERHGAEDITDDNDGRANLRLHETGGNQSACVSECRASDSSRSRDASLSECRASNSSQRRDVSLNERQASGSSQCRDVSRGECPASDFSQCRDTRQSTTQECQCMNGLVLPFRSDHWTVAASLLTSNRNSSRDTQQHIHHLVKKHSIPAEEIRLTSLRKEKLSTKETQTARERNKSMEKLNSPANSERKGRHSPKTSQELKRCHSINLPMTSQFSKRADGTKMCSCRNLIDQNGGYDRCFSCNFTLKSLKGPQQSCPAMQENFSGTHHRHSTRISSFPAQSASCQSDVTSTSSFRRSPRRSRANRKSREQQRVTLMLTVVVIIFLMCQLPWTILFLYRAYLSSHHHGAAAGSDAMKIAGNVVNLLVQMNASGNFYLYSFFSGKFRRTLARLCLFRKADLSSPSANM